MLFFRSRRCVGHVLHGQWALLATDMLVLIDRSACLVEPNTCDQRIKCARASRSAHGSPCEFHRVSVLRCMTASESRCRLASQSLHPPLIRQRCEERSAGFGDLVLLLDGRLLSLHTC